MDKDTKVVAALLFGVVALIVFVMWIAANIS